MGISVQRKKDTLFFLYDIIVRKNLIFIALVENINAFFVNGLLLAIIHSCAFITFEVLIYLSCQLVHLVIG